MSKIHIGDMSRKKAIEILKDMLEAMNVYQGISPRPERINAVKMGIESLEREPILDKIRAEMEQIKEAEYQIYGKGSWRFVDKCLDIIDKYKAESEDKE